MARKTRSEQLEIISRRIEASNRWRDELGYDRLWRRLLDLYRGQLWPSTSVNNEDLIAVNRAVSTVNVIAPSVSVNHPKITVSPNKQEVKHADPNSSAFYYPWFNETNFTHIL